MVKRYYTDEHGEISEDKHGNIMYYADHAALEALVCDLFDAWALENYDVSDKLSDAITNVTNLVAAGS